MQSLISNSTKKVSTASVLSLMLFASTTFAQSSTTTIASPDATSNTAGQSTIDLGKQVEAVSQPRKVSGNLTLHNEAPIDSEDNSVNRGSSDIRSVIMLTGTYKLSADQSITAYGDINNSWGQKRDGRADFALGDQYLQFAQSGILKTQAGNLSAFGRVYIPTSEESRNVGLNYYGRLGLNWSKEFNKYVTVSYEFEPRFFNTYKSSFLTETSYGSGKYKRSPTPSGGLLHFLTASVSLIPGKLTFEQDLGFRRRFYNSDANSSETGVSKGMSETIYSDTRVTYRFNPTFSLVAGVDEDAGNTGAGVTDLLAQDREFSLYRGDETLYYLEASAAF